MSDWETSRPGTIPEPVMVHLQQVLSHAAASPTPGMPPMTPAAVVNTLSVFGLKVVPTTQMMDSPTRPLPATTPVITMIEKTRQGLAEETRSQKEKQIPENGYESARDDTASSKEEEDPLAQLARKEVDLREEHILRCVKQYEHALRLQEMSGKAGKRGAFEHDKSERDVTAKATPTRGRVQSPKRKYTEGRRGETQRNSREKAISTIWTPPG